MCCENFLPSIVVYSYVALFFNAAAAIVIAVDRIIQKFSYITVLFWVHLLD